MSFRLSQHWLMLIHFLCGGFQSYYGLPELSIDLRTDKKPSHHRTVTLTELGVYSAHLSPALSS